MARPTRRRRRLLSEAAIVAGIATATIGSRSRIDWKGLAGDYAKVRDHISRVVPGFSDFNARLAQGPFYLPNAARDRRWNTQERQGGVPRGAHLEARPGSPTGT